MQAGICLMKFLHCQLEMTKQEFRDLETLGRFMRLSESEKCLLLDIKDKRRRWIWQGNSL